MLETRISVTSSVSLFHVTCDFEDLKCTIDQINVKHAKAIPEQLGDF